MSKTNFFPLCTSQRSLLKVTSISFSASFELKSNLPPMLETYITSRTYSYFKHNAADACYAMPAAAMRVVFPSVGVATFSLSFQKPWRTLLHPLTWLLAPSLQTSCSSLHSSETLQLPEQKYLPHFPARRCDFPDCFSVLGPRQLLHYILF